MELDRQERVAVARFFAKRFPGESEREEIARAAGLPRHPTPATSTEAAWERLLQEAEARRALGRLGRAAVAQAPGDANLARAASLLGTGEPRLRGLALGALLLGVPVAVVGLVGVVAWWAGSFSPSPAEAAPRVEAAAGDLEQRIDAPAVASDASAERPDPSRTAGSQVDEQVPVQAAPTAARTEGRRVGLADGEVGRCAAADGGLVGYWWAGEQAPGGVGDVVTVSQHANVRAWAPSEANGFDLSGPVRCVLAAGDRVRVREAPIRVAGGAVWVPLHTGDLLTGG